MIPILYESNETSFTSNGLGRLRDCIRCEVTEERNGVYECEFDYPVAGAHYEDIVLGRIIAVEHDNSGDVQPFDIYASTKNINGVVTFYAQHISYRQNGLVVSGTNVNNLTAAFYAIKNNSVPDNPFTYRNDLPGNGKVPCFDGVPRTVREVLGGIEGSILDTFGGEYEFDKFNVNLWESRGKARNLTIRYGVNLTEFTEEMNYGESYTAVIPFWQGEDSVVVGRKVDSFAQGYDGREFCIPLDVSEKFESKPDQIDVEQAGRRYLQSNQPYLPSQNIKIDFIHPHGIDEYAGLQDCELCDSVRVVFPLYKMEAYFKIVSVVWDVLLEKYISMELGNLRTSLSQALGIGGIQASADQANRNVAGVWGTAAGAQATASGAAEAAAAAQASADSASEAATTAWNHAEDAHQAATSAQESAEEAKASARSANNSANNALVQLSVVEDVAGTLRWISEHGEYVLTTDTTVHSDTVYFVYQFGDYVPIVNPPAGSNPSALGWYVLDVTQSTTDYIMAHMAVTSAGLWVLPVNQLAPHELVDSQGNQLVDSSNNPIVDFSSDPQNATGYKVLLSGGGGQTGDFPIGVTIYNDEGEAVANYGTTTTIGASSGNHIYIDSDSVEIKDDEILLASFSGSGISFYKVINNVQTEVARLSAGANGRPYLFIPRESDSGSEPYGRGSTVSSFGFETETTSSDREEDTGIYRARYTHHGIKYNSSPYFVGTVLADADTSEDLGTSEWAMYEQIILPAGTWIVTFGGAFASNSNGMRYLVLTSTYGNSQTATRQDIRCAPATGGATSMQSTRILKLNSNTTYYVYAYQNSGSTLTVSTFVRAIKII